MSSTIDPSPLRKARISTLFLSWAVSTAAGAVGLNALIKANQAKSFVKSHAPTGVSVSIDTNDLFSVGVVVTTVCAWVALLSFIDLFFTLFPPRFLADPVRKLQALRIQSVVLIFSTIWIVAAEIPYDFIAATRQAKIVATIGKLQLPPDLVRQQQEMLGVSPVYWDANYVRDVAFLPWFSAIFGFAAAGVAWTAAAHLKRDISHENGNGNEKMLEKRLDDRIPQV